MGVSRLTLQLLGLALAAVLSGAAPAPVPAQGLGRVISPIVTLDRDRLFSGTLYGQRVNRELEAASNAMAAETRKIEAALEEEERQLTEQRQTLDPAAFRDLAQAFDEKVQALRAERETAQANLRRQIEDAQTAFFERIGPILGALVRERGAVMILDRRAILLTAADVDITEAAIARIDATLGDGGAQDSAVDSPLSVPDAGAPETTPAPGDGAEGAIPPATNSGN